MLVCLALAAPAQVLLDLSQELYSADGTERGVNYNSQRGNPGSKSNFVAGTDGRVNNQTETATLNQFRGIVTYGAVVVPKKATQEGPLSGNFEQNAAAAKLNLPRGNDGNGTILYVLRASQAGAPTFGRLSVFNFGAIISPPLTDEGGNLLSQPNTYWAAEPYSTNGHVFIGATITPAGYYYSPHAQAVFATQPGPIQVVWRKAESATGTLSGDNKVRIGGLDYALTNASYIVSGVASKTPRKLYWTEKTFRATGKPVSVPTARVGAVYFHYNSAFPRTTDSEFVEIGSSSANEGNGNATLEERRTAWYDNGQGLILAYNKEGRVFLELLGDPTGDNVRRHLGYEILDVLKQPVPVDLSAELGEKISAYADGRSDLDLDPSPVLVGVGDSFLYQDPLGSNGRTDYYAVKETQNRNDVLVHWLEEGVESLRWPLLFNRYAQVWPESSDRYSHYVRPAVPTQAEAANTAVALPADNAPALQYQDPLDKPRGFLNERSQFYTFLEAGQPVHRALLRFNAGERVAFERVLSMLDAKIKPPHDIAGPLDLSVPVLATRRAAFLNLINGGAALPTGLLFNSQGFTVESWVYLQTNLARLFDFTVAGQRIAMDLTAQVAAPVATFPVVLTNNSAKIALPVSSAQSLGSFNSLKSQGGLVISFDFESNPDAAGQWVAINLGLAFANRSASVNGAAEHFGIWFSKDGTAQAFDGSSGQSAVGSWSSTALTSGHIDVVCSDPADGNPFDGVGSTKIEVYANHATTPFYTFTKASGGYANNNVNFISNNSQASGTAKAASLTGFAIASGSLARPAGTASLSLPPNQWVHVALVGDVTRRILYLNGEQVGEASAAIANNGTVTAGTLGSAGLALDEFRLWSVAQPASQIQAGLNRSYLAGTSDLELQYSFNEVGTLAYNTSGKGDRDLSSLAAGSLTTGNPASPGAVSQSAYPRYVQATAYVGDRINPPTGEQGDLAGYILQASGTLFHPVAYQDPFAAGFEAAKGGAIIPVNAFEDKSILEVWWFRKNGTNAVKNAENGFKPIYWPAVIGRYKLGYPEITSSEIILASNAGSGALTSQQAKGTIYTQNDRELSGYNPNEEHAVMIGGQAYALRDDLNITSGETYSSMPYVLLDYTAEDGRPAVRAFKVSREDATKGIVFDSVVEAGKQLQAPMPLPFLPSPVEVITVTAANGDKTSYTTNYNFETSAAAGDLPVNWANLSDSQKADYTNYSRFTYRDRNQGFWVLRGLHAGLPTLAAGTYNTNQNTFVANVTAGGAVGIAFTNYIHTSRRIGSLLATVSATTPLPVGLVFGPLKDGLAVYGKLTANSGTYTLIVTDADGATTLVNLTLNSTTSPQAALNVNKLIGRPPQLAEAVAGTNAFKMRFYYKTQEGFAWPNENEVTRPKDGTIVPYLRTRVGDGFTGNGKSSSDAALDIVYRPVWLANAPVVAFGETLTEANAGRPAIRGQTSAKVLYQQSIATNITVANAAVILHDPTRERVFGLGTNDAFLAKLPATVRTESYQGKTFFPNLPPHLAERFFFDPVRGPKGSLVFKGEFKNELFGEKYLLLNVLAGSDLATVQSLCPASPPADKQLWDTAIDRLVASVETFYENPSVLKQFIVNPVMTVTRSVGELIAITNDNTAVDSYALSAAGPGQGYVSVIVGDGEAFTPAGEPVSMYVLRVTGSLYRGEIKVLPSANPLNELITFEHTADLGGKFDEYEYEWKINPPVDGFPPVTDATMSRYQALTNGTDIKRYTLGGSGIQTLVDNWIVMRYRPKNLAHPLLNQWSDWSAPQLAEGWIKRVLAGINPFGQRVTDLYNNSVNTDVSLLTQAGKRYEGDIALNMDNINNYGLIEIYETVLKRGRDLSIDASVPINFGPANDALLLAAGYLNDLYMLVGNEAYADAANPTIGIGQKDSESGQGYGDITTALFAFKGQTASLLDEELSLLRGRDDVALPGVQIAPVYNRLVWNFTRGIDAGEVIYALNYNILDQNTDGKADATDAAKLFPQGHGDAYGHYLTALKGYYTLLTNPNFDWVPRVEAVTVLGQPVSVDYLDERKFATAAMSVARTGRQIFDLSWRKDYTPGRTSGWESFSADRVSSRTVLNGTTTTNIVRHWGMDQWASRTGQGALLNWVVGNTMLPEVDPDPSHEGIQKVDRTTVPELRELVATASDLQAASDNAESRLTPLGVTEGSIAFDLNPNLLVGDEPKPHFEQVYERTKIALNNAVSAFDDAKDVTRILRSQEDSLLDLRSTLAQQELAFTNALIEIYGTPYPDDVGAGKTYKQGYAGPDLFHYAYVETPELNFGGILNPTKSVTFQLDVQNFPSGFVGGQTSGKDGFDFLNLGTNGATSISYTLASHGYFEKPAAWTGRRHSPGEIQQAISDVIKGRAAVFQAMDTAQATKTSLDGMVRVFKAGQAAQDKVTGYERAVSDAELATAAVERFTAAFTEGQMLAKDGILGATDAALEGVPRSLLAGLAVGGDLTAPIRGALQFTGNLLITALNLANYARTVISAAIRTAQDSKAVNADFNNIRPTERTQERVAALNELANALTDLQAQANDINQALQSYDDAQRALSSLVARGERLQAEREITRQRAAAMIQGYRTGDAAFRIFRNEKLERYKTLFDLASRYAFLAANAYDYDTGLLGTEKGRSFVNRIVSSRALGVVRDGEPQFAGSNTGDPGISSALAEMKADFDVLKGRLGFNAPDAYNTLASLRSGNLRILPTPVEVVANGITIAPGPDTGLPAWQDYLQQSRMENILEDADVRRYCQQVDPGTGLPVPGIVITFSTSINPGESLFGKPLAAGDSSFHRSYFATKIHSVGVALEGYIGMNYPGHNSTADPNLAFLDPRALAANPYVYLIPVGVDTMRSPPLGDASQLRTWKVDDIAIPLPFNIGGSGFSTKNFYQAADSLTEPLFTARKHQAFRPTDSIEPFTFDVYNTTSMQFSQYTNRRLIGRSVWNSQWKLVIPGDTLLADPKEGLSRLIQTVTDIKLYFTTYSYSGN